VKAPEILSIDPTSGSAREQVSVHGYFFGTKKGHVYLGYEVSGKPRKKSCSVPSWTMNPTTNEGQIVFVVPRLTPGTYDLIVTNSVGSDTLIEGFTIK
jgi:hypothetical protein